MAKISEYPEETSPGSADIFVIDVDLASTPATKKITLANLINAIVGGSSGHVQFNAGGSFGGDDALFWDNVNKRLGIGTTGPDGILHLDNGASDTDLIIEKDAGTAADIIFHNAGAAAAHIAFDSNEDIVIENDTADKDIIFKVLDGAVDTEMMRIDGSLSRVGIGVAAPAALLDVRALDGSASRTLFVYENLGITTADAIAQIKADHTSTSVPVLEVWNDGSGDSLSVKDGGTQVFVIKDGGNVGIGTTSPTISDGVGLHLAGKILRIGTAKTPATAGAAGNAGEICWDTNYLYCCVATNTWKRVAMSTW